MSNETINDLRARLFAAIDGVKNASMTLEQAKLIADLGQVLVNTAKAENEFLRITGRHDSTFLAAEEGRLPQLGNGIVGVRRHLLKDS
jgi:hypothetical protein